MLVLRRSFALLGLTSALGLAGLGCSAEPATAGTGGSAGSSGSSGAAGSGGTGAATTGGASGNGGASGSGGALAGGSGGIPGGGTGATSGGSGGAGGSGGSPVGGNGGSGGGAGSGGSTAAELVLPIQRGNLYVLEFENVLFEVDPAVGARVTRFSYAGQNILIGSNVNAENWGATFWTAPQNAWPGTWPPPAQYNTGAFAAALEGNTIVLTSAPTTAPYQVTVTKRFSADLEARAIVLEYGVTNVGQTAANLAPWEISRHAGNGLTFFPTGSVVGLSELTVQNDQNGLSWYQNVPASIVNANGDKFEADGAEGWLAHTDGQLLFVKTFPDLTPAQQAPMEGEVEIYANKVTAPYTGAYVEVEAQGPYGALGAGQTTTWTVRWYLAALPDGVSATVGDAALASFARELIQ